MTSAPVNSVGELRKSSGVPTGTPGIPGNGLRMALPGTVCRPRPGGPSATRSASMADVNPWGRKKRPAAARRTVFRSDDGVQITPAAGEKLFRARRVGPRPSLPRSGASKGGLLRS